MNAVWLGRDGNKHGPYTAVQLLDAHANGKLRETDLLWWQGLDAWEGMASAIEKLRQLSAASPALARSSDQPQPALELAAPGAPAAVNSATAAASSAAPASSVDANAAAPAMRRAGGGAQRGVDPYRPPAATVADPAASAETVTYAGFWVRFAAFVIDTLIVSVAGLLIGASAGFIFVSWLVHAPALSFLFQASGILISWAFYAWFESSEARATPGKMLFHLKVVHAENHERISFLRATGRYWAKFLSAMVLLIGYLMQPFTARKQALHDMMTSVVVVSSAPPSSVLLWLCLFLAFVPVFFVIFALIGVAVPFARWLF